MKDNEKNLVQSFYEIHHKEGQRLNQIFLESIRGRLFADWIGKNKKFPKAFARNIAFRCNNENP